MRPVTSDNLFLKPLTLQKRTFRYSLLSPKGLLIIFRAVWLVHDSLAVNPYKLFDDTM